LKKPEARDWRNVECLDSLKKTKGVLREEMEFADSEK
jgi:hypothetical protein